MGFLMDGLDAEAYDRKYKDSDLIARIWKYFKPQAPRLLLTAGIIVLVSVVDTGFPILISRALDQVQADPKNTDLIGITFLITTVSCLWWVFNFFRRRLSTHAVGEVVLKLRQDAFDAVTRRDLSFYDQFASGKIVNRVTSDTQQFSQTVTLVTDLLSQFLLIFLLIGYLFTVNVRLTLLVLVLAPVIIIVALSFRRVARYTITQSRRASAEVSSQVQETVSGISVAKTFRQEPVMYKEFKEVNDKSYRINIRTGYTFSAIFPILDIIAGVGTAAIVYFGGLTARETVLTAGEWFLFIQGLQLFWFPLTSIASFWSQFQLGLAASERVFALLDAEAKVVQTDNKTIPTLRGEIRFEGVNFAYKEDEPVLQNFSLTIKPGETLALVGHTGSGKSSIGKLIARFYEFQGGRILIDGVDIRALDLSAYRSKLGIVTQTPFLFDGTIMENIRYGKAGATDAEVEAVAKSVGGGDWIRALPNGLLTEVGERGGNLSMGQRQLVALARVQLQNPSIFILDEATASVDPFTEALIQEGLESILHGRTSIVIAHRLSTIREADRIIVLRKGEIIEEGNHDQLLKSAGHYAELYNTYFRHQSLEYIESARESLEQAAR
jgi:ABC-type multidrug transport system fused ATPase/permease subunit